LETGVTRFDIYFIGKSLSWEKNWQAVNFTIWLAVNMAASLVVNFSRHHFSYATSSFFSIDNVQEDPISQLENPPNVSLSQLKTGSSLDVDGQVDDPLLIYKSSHTNIQCPQFH